MTQLTLIAPERAEGTQAYQETPDGPKTLVASPGALQGHSWRCWTADTPEETAAAEFCKRFGVHPQYILEWSRMLWLGPIPESEVH